LSDENEIKKKNVFFFLVHNFKTLCCSFTLKQFSLGDHVNVVFKSSSTNIASVKKVIFRFIRNSIFVIHRLNTKSRNSKPLPTIGDTKPWMLRIIQWFRGLNQLLSYLLKYVFAKSVVYFAQL